MIFGKAKLAEGSNKVHNILSSTHNNCNIKNTTFESLLRHFLWVEEN